MKENEASITIVGVEFPDENGYYDFPSKNGSLVVNGSEITMCTRGNGEPYINPNANVNTKDCNIEATNRFTVNEETNPTR
jgi:hypothetical protein